MVDAVSQMKRKVVETCSQQTVKQGLKYKNKQ